MVKELKCYKVIVDRGLCQKFDDRGVFVVAPSFGAAEKTAKSKMRKGDSITSVEYLGPCYVESEDA